MGLKVRMSPMYNSKDYFHKTFGKDWFEFQLHAEQTGMTLQKYVKGYITSNHKRSGAKGKLAKAINFDILSTTGKIHWGIGHIPTLNQRVKGWGGQPYWYTVNYGKMTNGKPFIPGGGKYRPVEFADGSRPNPGLRGKGTSRVTKWAKIKGGQKPTVIRPMNFIEAGYKMLHIHVIKLLARYHK